MLNLPYKGTRTIEFLDELPKTASDKTCEKGAPGPGGSSRPDASRDS